MPKQTDFIKTIHKARLRVNKSEELVAETQKALDYAVANKLHKAAERMSAQLKRQQTNLAFARAELAEWENAK